MEITLEDIRIYIEKIQLNFENAYVLDKKNRALLMGTWYDAFKEYPKEICDQAVNNALKKAKFAPRLGDITEEIENILNANSKTDEELWAELVSTLPRVYEISRYLGYSHYSAWAQSKLLEVFNSLDQILQTYLVNVSTLVELSELEEDSLKYEKARFYKQLPNLRKLTTERKKAQLFLDNLHTAQLTDGKNK